MFKKKSKIGGGQSLSIENNINTSAFVNSTLSTLTNANVSVSGNQAVTVSSTSGAVQEALNKGADLLLQPCSDLLSIEGRASCANALNQYQNQGQVVGSCGYCIKLYQLLHATRMAMEQEAQNRNSGYQIQQSNQQLDNMMTQGATATLSSNDLLGPCELMCQSVLVKGLSQEQTFQLNTSVIVNTTQVSNIVQNMSEQLASAISNKQDFPGQVLDSLFGNKLEVSNNITSILEANLTQEVINQFLVEAKNQQAISITGDSIYASNIKQSFSASMTNDFRVLTNIVDEVKQSSDISISSLVKNENDTIGTLVNTLIGSLQVMSKAINDITTAIVISAVAIVVTAILVIAARGIFSPVFAQNAIQTAKQEIGKRIPDTFRPVKSRPQ